MILDIFIGAVLIVSHATAFCVGMVFEHSIDPPIMHIQEDDDEEAKNDT